MDHNNWITGKLFLLVACIYILDVICMHDGALHGAYYACCSQSATSAATTPAIGTHFHHTCHCQTLPPHLSLSRTATTPVIVTHCHHTCHCHALPPHLPLSRTATTPAIVTYCHHTCHCHALPPHLPMLLLKNASKLK